ncbi:hypothetical protein [Neorhizobium sp. LjRoot104]|uniref:hypothetical protein n=1 Tax=Neorhizobium sp. LjRoot104 TaxID=3342254 RepID=UPI003ECE5504
MIDVAVAIDGEAVNVTRTRAAAGAYNDDGEWVPGSPDAATIRAAIQPASGNQLMDVPEGMRTEARWLLWSRSEVKVDDMITSGGVSYRVMHLWPRADGGFYRAAIGRLDP